MRVYEIIEPRTAIPWPRKFEVFGVGVRTIDYGQAIDVIIQATGNKQSALTEIISFTSQPRN